MVALLFGGLQHKCLAQTNYIEKHLPLADSLSKVYGIPPAIIMGVAIVETGGGASRNSKLLNNHFGIVGPNNLKQTHGIKTRYRQYEDVKASFAAFCQLISNKYYYAKLKGSEDAEKWLESIARAGYSTQPSVWKKRIMMTISRYDL